MNDQGNFITAGIYSTHFSSCIGILEQEKIIPQEYILNVEATIPAEPLERNPGDLNYTVSYADIFDIVKKEMLVGGDLLENMAFRISHSLLRRYPSIIKGFISITKLNPPIEGMKGEAGIKYFFKNNS